MADAALICGYSAEQCPALYYYAPEQKKLHKQHQDIISSYFKYAKINKPEGNSYCSHDLNFLIGSKLQVTPIYVKNFFYEQLKLVNSLRPISSVELFQYHNELVLYTYMILSLATCHRPVTRPFEFRSDIDLNRKLIWISDKEVRNGLSPRIIYLCDRACEQIKRYDQHLKWLEKQLRLNNSHQFDFVKKAQKSQLPYLFFLKPKKTFALNPEQLKDVMIERWPIALNWQRHFMRTQLKLSGLTGDEVDAFMGHARFGEEIFGPYSGFSVGTLKDITSKINNIFDNLEIKNTSEEAL